MSKKKTAALMAAEIVWILGITAAAMTATFIQGDNTPAFWLLWAVLTAISVRNFVEGWYRFLKGRR